MLQPQVIDAVPLAVLACATVMAAVNGRFGPQGKTEQGAKPERELKPVMLAVSSVE